MICNLIVLKCSDIERSKSLYEILGMIFVAEKHGNGPRHYSSIIGNLVFELYPKGKNRASGNTRIGFSVLDVASCTKNAVENGASLVNEIYCERQGFATVLKDVDGNIIHLSSVETNTEHGRTRKFAA